MKNKMIDFIIVFLVVMYKYIMYFPFVTNSMLYALILVILLLSFVSIFNSKFRKNDFLKIVFLLVLSLLAIFNTQSVNMIFPLILAMIFYKKDLKDLAKYFFISLVIGFLLTVLLNFVGILPSHNINRYGIPRYSLGFIHPGFVFLYFIFICLSAYVAFDNEKKVALWTLPFALILYKLSLSRTGLFSYFIFLAGIFFKRMKDKKTFKFAVRHMFPILTVVTILATILNDYSNFELLDSFFSGRLTNYMVYIENGLLTNPIGMDIIRNYTIDNYYLYFFLDYGYIGYFIWLIFNYFSMKKMNVNSKYMFAMFIVFVYGICDSNVVVTSINFMLTIQFIYLIRSDKKNEQKS